MNSPKLKRRYLRQLKTLGYRYNHVGKYYYLDEGEIRYMVDRKTRVFRAYTMRKIVGDFTFCGVVHKNVTSYVSEDIEMIPNIPKGWYVEKEKKYGNNK